MWCIGRKNLKNPLKGHAMKILSATVLLTFTLFGASCNKEVADSTSSLKTLDNFAGNENFKINICGPSSSKGKAPHKLTAPSKLKSAVLSTYGAMPANLHKAVMGSSGEVRVSSASDKICANAMTNSEKEFSGQGGVAPGCWKLENKKVVLVLPESEKAIRHGMLRLAGYVYSQVLSQAYKGKKNGIEFDKRRSLLAEAFKEDLKIKQKGMSPKLTKLAQSKNDFGNFVLAESIDSYYCNPETKASFQKNFPRAYQSFSNGLNSFKGDLGKTYFE